MATFNQIKEVRLTIDDPAGYIDLIEAVTLPSSPAPWTAYKKDGIYWVTTKTEGADPTDYTPVTIRISDARLGSWIDSGTDAVQQAYKAILAKIGNEMIIVRNDAGAESTQFTALKDLQDYYRGLIASEGASSGAWARSTPPEIAGGNL